jgi:hypothetical protein
MMKHARNASFVLFAGALFATAGFDNGSEVHGLTHGYYCAAVCDDHAGNQCPSPPPFWYQCVNECLAAGCNFNPECAANGIPEAEEWCEEQ